MKRQKRLTWFQSGDKSNGHYFPVRGRRAALFHAAHLRGRLDSNRFGIWAGARCPLLVCLLFTSKLAEWRATVDRLTCFQDDNVLARLAAKDKARHSGHEHRAAELCSRVASALRCRMGTRWSPQLISHAGSTHLRAHDRTFGIKERARCPRVAASGHRQRHGSVARRRSRSNKTAEAIPGRRQDVRPADVSGARRRASGRRSQPGLALIAGCLSLRSVWTKNRIGRKCCPEENSSASRLRALLYKPQWLPMDEATASLGRCQRDASLPPATRTPARYLHYRYRPPPNLAGVSCAATTARRRPRGSRTSDPRGTERAGTVTLFRRESTETETSGTLTPRPKGGVGL